MPLLRGKRARDEFEVLDTTPRAKRQAITVTPPHRLLVTKEITPRTSKTPTTQACSSVYKQGRQLFARSTDPQTLVGRSKEQAELERVVVKNVRNGTCGSIYMCGPPGTGKTALVTHILEQCEGHTRTTIINCMSVRTADELVQKLVAELGLDDVKTADDLQKQFKTTSALVVLDEIDSLIELDLQLLLNLFRWAATSGSKLVLIGIANALDLPDRYLSQLKKKEQKPVLLPVLPYTAAQIVQVITAKLKTVDDSTMPPFLHPAAIQFCAKKVAAQTGDLRMAFDICQRAIDLAEQETIAKEARAALTPSRPALGENTNLASPKTPRTPKEAAPTYTASTIPRATIAHMAKVTSQVFSNGANQRLATLNLQQKAVLCSLAALERQKRALQMDRVMFSTPSKSDRSAPTTKQLYESYSGLCKRSDMLHPLSIVEFREVVSGLETNGLVSGTDGKHGSFVQTTPSRKPKTGFVDFVAMGDDRRISSVIGERELRAVLNTAGGELLREIIDGDC